MKSSFYVGIVDDRVRLTVEAEADWKRMGEDVACVYAQRLQPRVEGLYVKLLARRLLLQHCAHGHHRPNHTGPLQGKQMAHRVRIGLVLLALRLAILAV